MTGHICGRCFHDNFKHPERCELGCYHFPALCCPGCPCESFEEAHP